MNTPPTQVAARLDPGVLCDFAAAVLAAAGMPGEKARFLAERLVENDLRGVFSHGTQQLRNYPRDLRDGQLNPDPVVRLVDESPTTLRLDGDGGHGYFPAYEASARIADKALQVGMAAATTGNHGHFGAAGIYARRIAARGLIAYVTSGHQLGLRPGGRFQTAAGGSPMCFALPSSGEPPFVLDFGAMSDLYDSDPHGDTILQLAPGMVVRSIGLGAVCQALGGFLAGVPLDPARAERRWPGANQGAFMIAIDPNRFMAPGAFAREMAEFIAAAGKLQPLAGFAEAMLPGEPEWRRAQAWRREGIPIGEPHAQTLRRVGEAFGVAAPV